MMDGKHLHQLIIHILAVPTSQVAMVLLSGC